MQKKYASIPESFILTAEKYPDAPAYRYRVNDKKETICYKELFDKVSKAAAAFEKHGVKNKNVAIFSENRIEWFISDMALLSIGSVDVPRGNDSTEKELLYILEHSDSVAAIVENEYVYKKIASYQDKLLFIIVLDSSMNDRKKNIISFKEFLKDGEDYLKDKENYLKKNVAERKREDIATIIYTSGTTGFPKGAVLTHENILHNIEVLPAMIELKEKEKLVSILPIWHIYERTISYVTASFACFTALTTKRDIKTDLSEEKPNIFISVPALWLNIYNTVMKTIDRKKFFAKNIAKFLIKRSVRYVRRKRYENNLVYLLGNETKENHKKEYRKRLIDKVWHNLAKKIVYKNILAITGGQMRLTISGGGALPMYIEDFLEACGIPLIVGWGITETSPVITLRDQNKNYRGTCGKPVPFDEIEVRDQEGNVLKDGELGVCYVKGPNIFKEYYKNKELTNELKKDGWFNTGDLGAYTRNGEIVLTGRAKETIVLMTGENVEPQPIENKALESPYILQMMLVGQDKPSIGALVVLDEENIKIYSDKHKIHLEERKLSEVKEIMKLIKHEINIRINEKHGFRPFERISKIAILDTPFRIENEQITQSLKMKRNEIAKQYQSLIDKMYSKD